MSILLQPLEMRNIFSTPAALIILVALLLQVSAELVYYQQTKDIVLKCEDSFDNCSFFGSVYSDETSCKGQLGLGYIGVNCVDHGDHMLFASPTSDSLNSSQRLMTGFLSATSSKIFEQPSANPSFFATTSPVDTIEKAKKLIENILWAGNIGTLIIKNAELTDEVVQVLAEYLRYDQSISKLDLSENPHITSAGWTALGRALENNITLLWINFCDCNFDEDASLAFFQALATIKSLEVVILKSSNIGNASISALKNLPRLAGLDISGNHTLTDVAFLAFADSPSLGQLFMNNCNVTLSDLSSLIASPSTKFQWIYDLALSENQIDDKGALDLFTFLIAQNKTMKNIRLHKNRNVTDGGINAVDALIKKSGQKLINQYEINHVITNT